MKSVHRILCATIAILLLLCSGCSQQRRVISNANEFAKYLEPYDTSRPIRFEIVFADGNIVEGEMLYANAPITCGNFIKLCTDGYYDGLTIHRVVDGMLIQGGDKNGNGTYRMDTSIRGEFSKNGWNNTLQHLRGTVSMARWSDDYNSADAQFFIMCQSQYSYDGKYAAFATITSGMGYIEQLSNVPDTDSVPNEPIVIETIRILGN